MRGVIISLCIALHRKCLSTSRLPVSEYCCVIAFNNLIDQPGDAKSTVNILLLLVGREHLIKIVNLPTIDLRLVNILRVVGIALHDLNLVGTANDQFGALLALPLFVRQHGPDPDCNLDPAACRAKATLQLLGTHG